MVKRNTSPQRIAASQFEEEKTLLKAATLSQSQGATVMKNGKIQTVSEDPNETDESKNPSLVAEVETLYERFGKEENLRILVDNWFECAEELQVDESGSLDLRKEKYVQFLKTLMGGQSFYIGKKLSQVHLSMNITDE